MAPQLTHHEIEELLGAYALDAVDADEAEVIEAHLVECPRCRSELAKHREATSWLSYSGANAPDSVWSRIAAELEAAPPTGLAPPLRLRPHRRARTRLLAVAVAAAVALIALLGVQVVDQNHRIDRLAAINDQRGLDQAAAAAAVSPDARTVRLSSVDGTHVVDAVVLPDGHGYLVRADLPRLDGDETYQLWGVFGAQTISLGVIGNDPAITPFEASGPLTALAITAERSGGAVAPTKAPIVQGIIA